MGAPGPWILHHTYDALGRLIRAQRPIASTSSVYTERYFYDGVRRVQELHNNPVLPIPPDDGEGSMENETAPATTNATWMDREYIHTPGYVDEYVCETDRFDVPMYHLQDANFNVVGLVDAAGGMLRQYTLDPYGRVIRSDQFAAYPVSRLGHQGLFFDRLDAGITTTGLLPDHLGVTGVSGHTPIPWLGAYQNRNRTYLPHYGRFGQGDPNGRGLPTADGLARAGQVAASILEPATVSSLMPDGVNLHIAYGTRPSWQTDPSGLSGVVGALMSGLGMADSALGALDTAYTGLSSGFQLTGMMQDYSFTMEAMVDIILDWDSSDEFISYEMITNVEGAAEGESGIAIGRTIRSALRAGKQRSLLGGGGLNANRLINSFTSGGRRPHGVPAEWGNGTPARNGQGWVFEHPTEPGTHIRFMEARPDSPHPGQQRPYVRWQRRGQALDVNGKPVPGASREFHIAITEFRYGLIRTMLE